MRLGPYYLEIAAVESLMQITAFIKTTFVLDAFEGEEFEGYSRGEMWNGFECPYFPLKSAKRLMEVLRTHGQIAFYDTEADQFVCAEQDHEDDPEFYGAVEYEMLGKLYPVGTRVWTWTRQD